MSSKNKSHWHLHTVAYIVLALNCVHPLTAQHASHLKVVPPETVGLDSKHLANIDRIANEGIANKKMPGCVIAVGRHGKLAYLKAFGHKQLLPEPVKMTTDTVFDMASITKPVATATSVMILWEQGKLRLRDRVSKHIPEFDNHGKGKITILQLLTHQGGLIPDNALADYNDGTKKAFERIYQLPEYAEPGSKFIYTDVGFILLADLVERLSGQNVHEFSQQHLFKPLGMTETGYLPSEALQKRSATTEQRNDQWIRGQVHDPRAYRMDGIAGHAGLFSTARDLAIYAEMMLNQGTYNERRILAASTVDVMTRAYSVSSGTRGLGWDKATGFSSNRGENLSERSFGHGGFTGTVLWIDPEHDLFYILLSNRVHPNGKGSVNHLAGRIGTVAVAAIRDSNRESAKKGSATTTNAQVLTGLDVIAQDGFKPLRGKRVGLITNQTGIDRNGDWNIRTMRSSPHVNLTALFSPEHGLEGRLDIAKIDDSVDQKTGMKIFSLYGSKRKPTKKQLAAVDMLVFDIQDIGTRFYTYISTMGLAMQAAAEFDKEFVVLDRPNPIGADRVDGPVLDAGKESFVGFHTIPIQHGMTIGELAKMFKSEMELDLKLKVVPVKNWERSMTFDQTGMIWVNPSPNMRNLNQAVLYPGIGLLETTNLSVGRGTDTPFELLGAPWFNAQEIAKRLNAANLDGVRFVPRSFTPTSSKFAGERCNGINILLTNRHQFNAIRTGFMIATIIRTLHPDDWQIKNYDRLLSNQSVFDVLRKGKDCAAIQQVFQPGVDEFMIRRARYLIYE